MNNLKNETSPYLLAHSNNPVNWYPWKEEAFEKAEEEDKPVFLSIGYSSCHWCHVMEKESFEDAEVAKILNDGFINIKVDREERPDIDKFYMNVCQILTGSGGWPLSLFLTSQKEPFFAATYIPKHNMHGRIGMIDLLPKIVSLWQEERSKIYESSGSIIKVINELERNISKTKIREDIFESALSDLKNAYDREFGGFGNAPKFPMAQNLHFLMRYYHSEHNNEALAIVLNTLKNMKRGGIWDHVGNGFHRYATDRAWGIPHFEKMVYDQGNLAHSYLEAFQITADESYKETAEQIFEYLKNHMTSAEGVFYTSEDADSEGEEGMFYIWSRQEIVDVLDKEELNLLSENFDIRKNKNILFLKKEPKDKEESLKTKKILKKLFDARENRTKPFKDKKILLDLNAMTITALLKGYDVLAVKDYLDMAKKAMAFLLKKLKNQDGLLYHSIMDNKLGSIAFLDDYAYFIQSLLDMYESTYEIEYLKEAIFLNDYLLDHYWDRQKGGFYFTHQKSNETIFRKKEYVDGAIPSGNAISMLNLARLGKMTQNNGLLDKAMKIIGSVSQSVNKTPSAYISLLISYYFLIGKTYEIVIVGQRGSDLEKELRMKFLPNKICLFKDNSGYSEIGEIAAYTSHLHGVGDQTTVYACKDYQCSLPVTGLEELQNLFR